MALSTREKKFVAAYDGNATKAAKAAGYAGDDATLATQGWRLMRRDDVREAIAQRDAELAERLVLTREERQELWSRIAIDPDVKMSDRLRALEWLGKSQADFTERLEVKGELTLEALVNGSMKGGKK